MQTGSGDNLYPMLFAPVYKDYLWGGSRIAAHFRRSGVPAVCAESWEISGHPDGPSVLRNGPLSGRTLDALVAAYGADLVGTRCKGPGFPLLLKILDAHAPLSVQVHPNQETAARHGGDAKTEAWVILHADPTAGVYAGLAEGVDAAALEKAAQTSDMKRCLLRHAVRQWDTILVPGGEVHALDAGCMVFEVQQASNTTYRIHDWGRVGPKGLPRELHLEEAFRVIRWTSPPAARQRPQPMETANWGTRDLLCESAYFHVERIVLGGRWPLPTDPGSFQALFVAEGRAHIRRSQDELRLASGTTCLVPAAVRGVEVAAIGGPATLLRVTLP